MEDVLRHDDGGVHEQADSNRKAAERHRVDAHARRFEQRSGQGNRQGHRQRDDQRRAQIAQQRKQHDHHECRSKQHRAPEAAERLRHQGGLVVHDPKRHSLGQRLPDIFNGTANASRDRDGVRAKLFDDARADHFAFEAMCNAAPDGRRLAHIGHIAEEDRHVFPNQDDRISQVVHVSGAADRPDAPLGCALHDETTGGVDVAAFDGVQHVAEAHATGRHAIRINLHLELAKVAAQTFDRRDTRHSEQPVLHVELREIPQRHQVGTSGLRFQREFEDFVQATRQARDKRRVGTGRQFRRCLRHTFRYKLPRAVVIGI